MEFIDEEYNKNENEKVKKSNAPKIILAIIILLVIACIGIFVAIMYLKTTQTKFSIDGKNIQNYSKYIIVEENGDVYISVKDIASELGYEYKIGEYKKLSQDKNKCYVECENEVAMLEANSNIVYKTEPSDTPNYDKYEMLEKVKLIDDKLYVDEETLELAFNVSFNKEENKISINTLNNLAEYWSNRFTENGYKIETEDNFNNLKAILYDMIVVENEKEEYGVISLKDGTEILTCKYEDIEFIESTQEFFVTNVGKQGVVTKDGNIKIECLYDEISILDKDLTLYLATLNGKKGILDKTGKILIKIEYDQIGVDSSLYPDDNITNSLFLYDNCIVVRKDKLWGMYNKQGQLILPIEYESFGCIVSTQNSANERNVLLVSEDNCEVIVVCKEKQYGLVNSLGTVVLDPVLNRVYSKEEDNKKVYYMEYGERTINVVEYLKKYNPTLFTKADSKIKEEKDQSNNNTANETVENNTNTSNNSVLNVTVN